jgi:hypothetical protein
MKLATASVDCTMRNEDKDLDYSSPIRSRSGALFREVLQHADAGLTVWF